MWFGVTIVARVCIMQYTVASFVDGSAFMIRYFRFCSCSQNNVDRCCTFLSWPVWMMVIDHESRTIQIQPSYSDSTQLSLVVFKFNSGYSGFSR